jgi:hypothetical protein
MIFAVEKDNYGSSILVFTDEDAADTAADLVRAAFPSFDGWSTCYGGFYNALYFPISWSPNVTLK